MKRLAVGVLGAGLLCAQPAFADVEYVAIGVKNWTTSLSPGGGLPTSTVNQQQVVLTIGGQKLFWTINALIPKEFNNAGYPGGSIRHQGGSTNIGFRIHPEVAIALGVRIENDFYGPQQTDYGFIRYFLLGVTGSHPIEGTNFSINGNFAIGKGNASPSFQAVLPNNSAKYSAYEIGGGYSFSKELKATVGYRVEKYDTVVIQGFPLNPANGMPASLVTSTAKGLIAGVSYTF